MPLLLCQSQEKLTILLQIPFSYWKIYASLPRLSSELQTFSLSSRVTFSSPLLILLLLYPSSHWSTTTADLKKKDNVSFIHLSYDSCSYIFLHDICQWHKAADGHSVQNPLQPHLISRRKATTPVIPHYTVYSWVFAIILPNYSPFQTIAQG